MRHFSLTLIFRYTVSSFSLVLALGIFAPLARAAVGSLPGYVILPLSPMGRSNQACIRVTINGKSTMLILDTGAAVTYLDKGFYRGALSQPGTGSTEQLPPELSRKVNANGQKAEVGYISSMKAGAMDFGKNSVVVTDLSETLNQFNNQHHLGTVAGLMGEDILHRYSALIDWRRRGVYFNTDSSKRMNPARAFVSSGWTAVPMSPTNGRHYTVACMVASRPVRLLVDTGAQFTCFCSGVVPLNVIYNRDTGSSMSRLSMTSMTLSMIGFDAIMHPAQVDNWKVGNYQIASSNVAVYKIPPQFLKEESAGDGPILGFLGAEFLAANNAVIDTASSTLFLKSNKR